MEQTGDNRASQFLIQKIAIDVQQGNAQCIYDGNSSIIAGLGRVYFSAHHLLIDVGLQVMT